MRGLSTDSSLLVLGIVKNSLGLLVGPIMVHVCCKKNIVWKLNDRLKMIGLNCVEIKLLMHIIKCVNMRLNYIKKI